MKDRTPSSKYRSVMPRWLCHLLRRHRGEVGYILGSGPYWMCDSCGEVIR